MRYVYYIDVGDMSKEAAKEYVVRVMEDVKDSKFFNDDEKVLYLPVRDQRTEIVCFPVEVERTPR